MDFVKIQLQEENIPLISTLHALLAFMYHTVKNLSNVLTNYLY